jgi:sugar lactone lactonase YvrE
MTIQRSRRTVLKTLGLGISGLAVTGGIVSAASGPERLLSFDPTIRELPESIAINKRGTKYLSLTPRGEIRAVSPDNQHQSTFASFELGAASGLVGTTGVTVYPNGTVYVGLLTYNAAGADAHGVWRVTPDGQRSLFAGWPPNTFPNGLHPYGKSVLVTDTSGGSVLRVRDGSWEVWASDPALAGTGDFGFGFPLGANGIARGSDGTVYVANIEKAQIVAIPIGPDGSAGTPEPFVSDPLLFGADGLAIDTRDNLYVAVNAGNRLLRVLADGTVETLASAADGLDGPAEVAFGTSRGEQKSLYIVNFAFFSLDDPSLMRMDVGVPGKPVHP